MEESNPELESFRQQWKAEVSARTQAGSSKHIPTSASSSRAPRRPPAAPRIAAEKAPRRTGEEEDHADPHPFHGLDTPRGGVDREESSATASTEPQSALEHYEKAVEKELQGRLGDSLNHYHKAFKVW
jgi:F-box protein 9